MLLAIIGLVIVLFITYEFLFNRKFKECANKLPGFPLVPFLGNAHQFKTTPVGFLNFTMETSKKGKVARMLIGPVLFVYLRDPVDIEAIITNASLQEKGQQYNLLKPWLGDGLLVSSGAKWRTRRKLITPSFHFNVLREFVPIFDKHATVFIEQLAKTPSGQEVDVYPMVTLCVLDTLAETAMGVKMDTQIGQNSNYVKAVQETTKIMLGRMVSMFWRFDFIFKLTPTYQVYKKHLNTMHTLTRNVIKERKEALQKEQLNKDSPRETDENVGIKKRMSFMDTLLTAEGNVNLSDEDIREEVDTFMFEGHDTTASGMSFLLYAMASNPDIQEKVYQEQLEIFGEDIDRELTYDDLSNMKYTEMAIRESLRIYPSVPFVLRKVRKDFNLNGIDIPAGCSLGLNILYMNRNPDVFKDPLKFIPERFTSDEISKRHAFSTIPFSVGPRNCIGQKFVMIEMKSILSKCLRAYRFLPGSEEPLLGSDLVLKSENGIKLKMERRNQVP